MMKKTISILLALVMIFSLSVPVFAFSAVSSAQKLTVDGKNIDCEKYNIDGSNYFKLRDLAQLLNGTATQFDVGWDATKGVVSITTDHAYSAPNGTELVIGEDRSTTAQVSAQTIMINGAIRTDLTVYNIGGSNFFKLREMGDALGFSVDYDASTNTAIVLSVKPSVPAAPAEPAAPVAPETPKEDESTQKRNAALNEMKRYYDYLSVQNDMLPTMIDLFKMASNSADKASRIIDIQNRVSTMWDDLQSMKTIMDDNSSYLSYYPLKSAFGSLEMPVYLGSDNKYISAVRIFNMHVTDVVISYEGACDKYLNN